MTPETSTIDRLFLELSQFTKATTGKELRLQKELIAWQRYASYCRSCALGGESDPEEFDEFCKKMDSLIKEGKLTPMTV